MVAGCGEDKSRRRILKVEAWVDGDAVDWLDGGDGGVGS